MGSETISKVRPSFERLRNILFGVDIREEGVHPKDVKINDKEFIRARLYVSSSARFREAISCGLYQNGAPTFSFRLEEDGLGQIDSQALEVSFGDSEKIRIKGRVSIGIFGDEHSRLIGDAYDEKKYKGLADQIVVWVERMLKEGRVGEIPFSLNHSSQQ